MKMLTTLVVVAMLGCTGCAGGMRWFAVDNGEREVTFSLYKGPFGDVFNWQSRFKGSYQKPTPEQIKAEEEAAVAEAKQPKQDK